ncbi:unnamed protein product [Dibothriocephalus latus]|uniref:Uncharacterized protein n=1 Tax=Dibothriocephalus latus TaxID=60516 RepID=A0A3P7NZF4_DIBLA|nr:unnamed protein product [Dibothriocephalus latus]
MTRWIQAGILTNDWASVTAEPTPRKDRRPRRSFHSSRSSRQVDPLCTFFTTDANELIPPSLSPLREKIKGREVGNESLVDAFPISLSVPGSISKATEQSAVSDFDSLVEASVVIEKPEKSPPRKMFRIPFDNRFLVDTTSLEETTIQATSDDPDETEVPTDSSFMQDRHWTREKNPPVGFDKNII